jgi:transcriptional regulator GlxA family with amidase domain
LAAAADISVRSVFVRFRERHGTTPMAYLRAVRLDQVRKLLAEGDDAASVIDIAMKCGFASFGHFARRYKDRFGELPSVTLARRAAEMS